MSRTLAHAGLKPIIIGRKNKNTDNIIASSKIDHTHYLINPLIHKGPFFYFIYNIRLFIFLLFRIKKGDILLANDLDTLPANYLLKRIKKNTLIFDSHELFTEVPELIHRPVIQKIWEKIEKKTLPHVDQAITVSPSIANYYYQKYNKSFEVIFNYPLQSDKPEIYYPFRSSAYPIILYQGVLNIGRGLENLIRAMKLTEGLHLYIAGRGDIEDELYQIRDQHHLEERVFFTGRLSPEELKALTSRASVGVSLEEDLGLNYRYALPNKLFDYIQAHVPVLVSDLPEMKKIVEEHNIGRVLTYNHPAEIARQLSEMIINQEQHNTWIAHLKKIAPDMTWEKQEIKIKSLFTPFHK